MLLLCVAGAAGQAVYASSFLPDDYAAGQAACAVEGLAWPLPSYACYMTVNATDDSNLFFWFFPAQDVALEDAPILMWLNGGPGFSSLFGLFTENGPFTVGAGSAFPQLEANAFTWNGNFSMLYVDNPVGVGFSYTGSAAGMATDEEEVGTNLYSLISQFFQLFPELQQNDFYITGESYAGKYVPAAAYKVHEMNAAGVEPLVPLRGISIGDGMVHPQVQTQGLADQIFALSMFDYNQREQGRAYEALMEMHIVKEEYTEAFEVFDEYLNGDFFPYSTFYTNCTGMTNYYNFVDPSYPPNPWQLFLNLPSTQAALHVKPGLYRQYNETVEEYLIDDWMRSMAWAMPTLLESYRVLVYNGQNDIILGPPPMENFLRSLEWPGQLDYLAAAKQLWYVDGGVAGYARQAQSLSQVVVRDAGHLVPEDQPQAALDMIQHFIYNVPFSESL